MKTQNKILEYVTDIKVKVGKIEEHLIAINGTIKRHEEEITNVQKFVWKLGGGMAVLLILIQIFSKFVGT